MSVLRSAPGQADRGRAMRLMRAIDQGLHMLLVALTMRLSSSGSRWCSRGIRRLRTRLTGRHGKQAAGGLSRRRRFRSRAESHTACSRRRGGRPICHRLRARITGPNWLSRGRLGEDIGVGRSLGRRRWSRCRGGDGKAVHGRLRRSRCVRRVRALR